MNDRVFAVDLQSGYNDLLNVGLSQYDVGVVMQFNVYDGARIANFAEGTTVTLQGRRPSGVGFMLNGTLSANVAIFTSTTDLTGEAGCFPAELRFVSGDTDIGTVNLMVQIERAPHPDGTIDADITRQETFIERLEALEEEIVPDQTLRIRGKAADAKSTGDAIRTLAANMANKLSAPTGGFGTAGQVLSTLGNGQTQWVDRVTVDVHVEGTTLYIDTEVPDGNEVSY